MVGGLCLEGLDLSLLLGDLSVESEDVGLAGFQLRDGLLEGLFQVLQLLALAAMLAENGAQG